MAPLSYGIIIIAKQIWMSLYGSNLVGAFSMPKGGADVKNRERQRANRRLKYAVNPPCDKRNCNRNSDGFCVILTSSDFGERSCPFFKDKQDATHGGDERGLS